MTFWVWIAIITGLVLLVALYVAAIGMKGRPSRRRAQREKAAELRRQAEAKLASAARREIVVRQQSVAAEQERQAAEQAIEEADAVDPVTPAG